ncbi:MAG TPA: hypothetical protein VKZ84_05195 [Bacteriovoracaceae bacterium]|nr:hypothetical protein [Bacteriovoracaceae bacterium]
MKKLLYGLIFCLSFSVHSYDEKKSLEVARLIEQEMKVLNSATNKGPDLLYRMLELRSEKLKLIHQKNNHEFLTNKNPSLKKQHFFRETRSYYNDTKDFALTVLKMFPHTNLKPHIHFAMAINSRDYGQDNLTEKYLRNVINHKLSDATLKHHARTALADHYYNEKKYPASIALYEQVIKNDKDTWLTKHLYNLSWCYLKNRNFPKAIEKIKYSYELTKDPKYVNIKEQLLESIGSFYVYADKTMEGLEFYLSSEVDNIVYLISMAKKSSNKGERSDSLKVLNAAQTQVNTFALHKHQETLYHAFLDHFKHYNDLNSHKVYARKLVEYYTKNPKATVELKDDAVEKLRGVAGILQIKLARDMKKSKVSYEKNELDLLLAYFDDLIQIDPNKKSEYLYFQGESFYSVKKYLAAAESYEKAALEAIAKKDTDYLKKILNSLLALTGLEVIEKKANVKYLRFSYENYLKNWPVDEKSEKIYPLLYNLYITAKESDNALTTIKNFNHHYPQHLKDQQEMMIDTLDLFVEQKDTVRLANLVMAFRDGYLSLSRDVIEQTEVNLGNVLFSHYQSIAKEGKKEEATKGFVDVYNHPLYPVKVKAQAAFYAALSYFELTDEEQGLKWLDTSLPLFSTTEYDKKREDIVPLIERLYRFQRFDLAEKYTEKMLQKDCLYNDSIQDRYFEILSLMTLAQNKIDKAFTIQETHAHCLAAKYQRIEAHERLLYNKIVKNRDLKNLDKFITKSPYHDLNENYPLILNSWYWHYPEMKKDIMAIYKRLDTPQTKAWITEVEQLAVAEKKSSALLVDSFWNEAQFDMEKFNASLEKYLLSLQQYRNEFAHLMEASQLDISLEATALFSKVYRHVGGVIKNLNPPGMDPELFKSFSAAMDKMSGQFFVTHKRFDEQINKAIRSMSTLTPVTQKLVKSQKLNLSTPLSLVMEGR